MVGKYKRGVLTEWKDIETLNCKVSKNKKEKIKCVAVTSKEKSSTYGRASIFDLKYIDYVTIDPKIITSASITFDSLLSPYYEGKYSINYDLDVDKSHCDLSDLDTGEGWTKRILRCG